MSPNRRIIIIVIQEGYVSPIIHEGPANSITQEGPTSLIISC